MDAQIEDAIRLTLTSSTETPHVALVIAAKTLAREVRRLQQAVREHQGAIVAAHEDGAEMVERLEERWPM